MASNSDLSPDELDDVVVLLRLFEKRHRTQTLNPVPFLKRLAELLEIHNECYLKSDPDPIDDYIPYSNPICSFGTMLKSIVDNNFFMEKLVGEYMWAIDLSRIGNCPLMLQSSTYLQLAFS